MKLLGLIGYPLSHSFSKKYFTEKFEKEQIPNFKYELFPISNIDEFPGLLRNNPNFFGLNVTIPYKEKVMKYLDEIEESAQEVGAVNCIKFKNGKLIGYNTDVYGFEHSLRILLGGLPPSRLKKEQSIDLASDVKQMLRSPFRGLGGKQLQALILGTGGAAKAVIYVLKKLGIEYKLVSRHEKKGDLTYSNITDEILAAHQLIVNTTPLGMSPNIQTYPDLNYKLLGEQHYLYDLVYNPEKTLFLKNGENQSAKTRNGSDMLYLQAEAGWKIWNEEND